MPGGDREAGVVWGEFSAKTLRDRLAFREGFRQGAKLREDAMEVLLSSQSDAWVRRELIRMLRE